MPNWLHRTTILKPAGMKGIVLVLAACALGVGVWWVTLASASSPEAEAGGGIARPLPEQRPSMGLQVPDGLHEERAEKEPTSDSGTEREASSLAELRARLAECIPASTASRCEEILASMLALGTDEAVRCVLERMEDPLFDFPHRASTFAELLADVDDPRVFPAARRVLERHLYEGSVSDYECNGYFELVARQGGKEGARFLLDQLSGSEAMARNMAGRAVALLEDRTDWPEFLELVRRDAPGQAKPVFFALAGWGDPDVDARLRSLGADATEELDVRVQASRAIASHLNEDQIEAFVGGYWKETTEEGRFVQVGSWSELLHNRQLPQERVLAQLAPALEHALRDSSQAVWGRVVAMLGDLDQPIPAGMLSALEALDATLQEDHIYKKPVRRVVARARRQR